MSKPTCSKWHLITLWAAKRVHRKWSERKPFNTHSAYGQFSEACKSKMRFLSRVLESQKDVIWNKLISQPFSCFRKNICFSLREVLKKKFVHIVSCSALLILSGSRRTKRRALHPVLFHKRHLNEKNIYIYKNMFIVFLLPTFCQHYHYTYCVYVCVFIYVILRKA